MDVTIARDRDRYAIAVPGAPVEHVTGAAAAARRVAALERELRPRWVWADTRTMYQALLAENVAVERATDLRLCHRILRHARATATSALALAASDAWDLAPEIDEDRTPTLLDALDVEREPSLDDCVAEAARQHAALQTADRPAMVQLLLRAESAGALIAAEIRHTGLPWSAEVHQRQLLDALGPRPRAGQRPAALARLAEQIRDLLDTADLNPDSQPELLRALRRAGVDATSTRRWEVRDIDHPVVTPLLEYKRLSRLHTANGWTWLDTWVRNGRFHPDYVPGGVVTGRWATRGSGALQLPKALRSAIVADPGHRLVVADVAQLEPRMLAAMSGDPAMLAACGLGDLYQGFVDRGVVATRQQAKIGMLAAMYGGTTGDAAELLPRLRRAFPVALDYVDAAAAAGERFERVTTWLGRTSPPPGDRWIDAQQRAYADDADEHDQRRATAQSRGWGRFTRNFVVQGTAAEWALCWLASLRRRLRAMGDRPPELVYFLHDEVIVHAPAARAAATVAALADAATEARQLLFGATDFEVPLSVDVVDDYGQAV